MSLVIRHKENRKEYWGLQANVSSINYATDGSVTLALASGKAFTVTGTMAVSGALTPNTIAITANVQAPFLVSESAIIGVTATLVNPGNAQAIGATVTLSLTASQSTDYASIYGDLHSGASAQAITGQLIGGEFIVFGESTAATVAGTLNGVLTGPKIATTSTANYTTLQGVAATVQHSGTGTIAQMTGGFFNPKLSANGGAIDGNITIADALQVVISNESTAGTIGTIATGRGLHVLAPSLVGSAPITNLYGIHVNNQGKAGITNSWGIYIDAQTGGGNPFALFSNGGRTVFLSTSATAFTLGPNGLTNPAWQADLSVASAATGLLLQSRAAGNGISLAVTSSGAAERLILQAKASTNTLTLNDTLAAATSPLLVGTATDVMTAGVTDAYTGALRLTPILNGAFTATRLNYFDINNVTGAGTITDAALFRFDANAGTHKAVDAGTTKTTPGAVTQWIKANVNGTLAYIPSYSSKTS